MAGTRYTFDVAGLYNGVFAMRDRQTGSIWTHYDGSALEGPMADDAVQLQIRPLLHTTWAEWVANYPDGVVLDWYPEFSDRYHDFQIGGLGLGPQFTSTILNWDDRLPENELVLGVELNREHRAYLMDDLPPQPTVIADRSNGFALAFGAILDGQALSFEVVDGAIVDDRGTTWDLRGHGLEGPAAGRRLTFVTSFITEWYGWAAYHPLTTIYGR